MSILELLKEDHKHVNDLLSEMSETTDRAAKKRAQLFTECKTALLAHSHAELEAFYKPLLQEGDDAEALLEAEVEHQVVESLVEDIAATEPTDEKWLAKVTVLKELIEHHVDEEESEIFKAARKTFDKKQLDAMGEEFEQLKEQEMAQTPA
jgi:hemerythrin superfamily protein